MPSPRVKLPTLVPLRAGARKAPAFFLPGAGGLSRELAPLADSLKGDRPILAVEGYEAGGTVEEMAVRTFAAMRRRQKQGPYRLVGYSFGGLLAIEVARLARQADQEVELLAVIDAIYDRRYWPTSTFITATAQRTLTQLAALTKMPLSEAGPMFAERARRLGGRLAGRVVKSLPPTDLGTPDSPARAACDAAMAAYKPRPLPGGMLLIHSADAGEFACDRAALWAPYVDRLETCPIASDHLGVVRDRRALDEIAAALDARLSPPARGRKVRKRRALLVASYNWLPATRLALALSEAGFAVEAVCPQGHTLQKVGFVDKTYPSPAASADSILSSAIEAAGPDLVIPCDDRSADRLHQLHARTDPETRDGAKLRALLARSLGAPENFPLLQSRGAIMEIAAEEDVRRPETAVVLERAPLLAWLERHGYPAVLKTDGSWGGNGVALVRDHDEALRAFDRLRAPPGLGRALKRLLIDGDASYLRAFLTRTRPITSVQAFVRGRPGNAAVACMNGKVLAAVYVEVLHSNGPTGPATVVRVLDHPAMTYAVEAMVRRLRLSGLCGFDFVLEPGGTGADLIELNPRATPTCHLISADGRDLMASLMAALRRSRTPRPRVGYETGLVALFPQEMMRDPDSGFLQSAHHDVPWQSPELVELGKAMLSNRKTLVDKAVRRFQRNEAWGA